MILFPFIFVVKMNFFFRSDFYLHEISLFKSGNSVSPKKKKKRQTWEKKIIVVTSHTPNIVYTIVELYLSLSLSVYFILFQELFNFRSLLCMPFITEKKTHKIRCIHLNSIFWIPYKFTSIIGSHLLILLHFLFLYHAISACRICPLIIFFFYPECIHPILSCPILFLFFHLKTTFWNMILFHSLFPYAEQYNQYLNKCL